MTENDDLDALVTELNAGVPQAPRATRVAPPSGVDDAQTARLRGWLEQVIERSGSDLLLVAGAAPSVRIDGVVTPFHEAPLGSEEIEDAIVDSDDAVDKGHLYVDPRLAHDTDRITKPHDQRLLRLVDHEYGAIRYNDGSEDQSDGDSHLHWLPPVVGARRVKSLSGSTGTTPPLLSLPESMMIFSVPPNKRSMVSRYIRLRVTCGAFLYSS